MNNKSKETSEIYLGERKVSKMNFSHIITIPKIFIQSTQYEEITAVRMIMLEDRCLKIIPVRAKNREDETDFML